MLFSSFFIYYYQNGPGFAGHLKKYQRNKGRKIFFSISRKIKLDCIQIYEILVILYFTTNNEWRIYLVWITLFYCIQSWFCKNMIDLLLWIMHANRNTKNYSYRFILLGFKQLYLKNCEIYLHFVLTEKKFLAVAQQKLHNFLR